ncbi:hypothetical protein XENOCAPTIV_017767 [Xenoophorus captivus]|uniref:Uncharacterized protein n=1 Tax=Xenoophorus captivus TaxID=1517983 RepID=A0ABV0RL21_9TELE
MTWCKPQFIYFLLLYYRSTLNSMMLVILVWQLGLFLQADAQIPDACLLSSTYRPPGSTSFLGCITVGTGQFSDFSNVQFVNISGSIMSVDPAAGMITYRPQILYMFSCKYPLQYLINNTQLSV